MGWRSKGVQSEYFYRLCCGVEVSSINAITQSVNLYDYVIQNPNKYIASTKGFAVAAIPAAVAEGERLLHDEITGKNYSYDKVREVAREISELGGKYVK